MRLLPPQRLRPHYFDGAEQALRGVFHEAVFAPLFALIPQGTLDAFVNTAPVPSPQLLDALRRGVVQYELGVFTGKFDAKLTGALRALGATFDARTEGYLLPEWAAPGWLKTEAAAAQARARALHDSLLREVARIQQKLESAPFQLPHDFGAAPVEAIEDGFESAAAAIGIPKRIAPAARAAMESRYAEQVRPYVAKATAEYIDGVHKAVTDNAARGYRYETLVADLEYFVGVSERKARFLARQETSLFMAGYRQERFTEAGVTRYRWSTSHDIRVRPYADEKKLKKYGDHRILDKQIFTYKFKAPAEHMSSKKPCNPGEDFGCRCIDLAVLE